MSSDSQWHLDKKVPIALIVTVAVQLAAFIWMAAKLDSRVSTLEETDRRHDSSIQTLVVERDGIRDRLRSLEEVQKATNDLLRRIDERLERMARP